jgi:hypothetical protein
VPPDMISQARSQLERELHPNDQLSLSPGDNSSESDEKGASQKRETDDSQPTCPPLSSPVPAGHGSCWHHANPWLGRKKKRTKTAFAGGGCPRSMPGLRAAAKSVAAIEKGNEPTGNHSQAPWCLATCYNKFDIVRTTCAIGRQIGPFPSIDISVQFGLYL